MSLGEKSAGSVEDRLKPGRESLMKAWENGKDVEGHMNNDS